MCALEGRNLSRSTLLVVGATGDVGSGCVRCLAPKVRRVLLRARKVERPRRLAAELEAAGGGGEIATEHGSFSEEGELEGGAASLTSHSLPLRTDAPA